MGNRVYFSHLKLFKCNILSKRTKMKLYKTLIQPVVTCGAETWTIKCNILYKRTKMKLYKTLIQPVVTCGAETWTIKCNILYKRTKNKMAGAH